MGPRDKINILLVDDQPGKLLSLETILAELGENVIKADSADEALRRLLEHEVAVVLVDVCMPRMDGFELAELIRAHPRHRRTAIIFISAVHLTDADRLRGYNLGAVDYIPVPIIPEVLRAKVAVFAELYRKTDQLERVNAELEQRLVELDRSNERLRFADRMATIGTLAAGLGHDMGNLLLPLRMRLDTLEGCELPAQAREDVAAIRTASEYLQRLARSLRLLALDSEGDADTDPPTNLPDWWRETGGMIRNSVARTIALCADIPDGLPALRIGKAGLTQMVFNLVQNAGNALKGRSDGHVLVAARPAPSGACVSLSVTDNGPGMTDEVKRRCLEPFFTTRTRELSTGLGLALVCGLVKRAQGSIDIKTSPGKGATFTLELPAAPHVPPALSSDSARKGIAVVILKDARLLAHVRSSLAGLCFEVSQAALPEADVWVADAEDAGALDAVQQFVSSRPGRHAFVFGAPADDSGDAARVTPLGRALKPSAINALIRETLCANGAGQADRP